MSHGLYSLAIWLKGRVGNSTKRADVLSYSIAIYKISTRLSDRPRTAGATRAARRVEVQDEDDD